MKETVQCFNVCTRLKQIASMPVIMIIFHCSATANAKPVRLFYIYVCAKNHCLLYETGPLFFYVTSLLSKPSGL